MIEITSEVLIHSGLHQWQHGRIVGIDYDTEIRFVHVRLRGKQGQFLERSAAYVPLKYCTELEPELCASLRQAAREATKRMRKAKARCVF
jgi:hypothetical protein